MMRPPEAVPESTRLPHQAALDRHYASADPHAYRPRDGLPSSQQVLALRPEDGEEDAYGFEDEEEEDDDDPGDLAELALLARIRGQDGSPEPQECDLVLASEHVLWTLEAAKLGPTGARKRPPALPWAAMARCCGGALACLLVLLLLLALTRANFVELGLEAGGSGALLAGAVPHFAGEAPVAATALALESRNLSECEGLSARELRAVRGVALVHDGVFRSVRVARSLRYGDSHLWLEAADGTAVRVQHGRAWFREGKIGDEQSLLLDGVSFREPSGTRNTLRPVAFFDVTVLSA
mmetsp:Transcript_81957/g.227239  ORF Transcript_81957/g.227239 Transcript_81957/m.227239 type:complete len:295 (+) Transcript_81957:64-948(+)